ncbi:hypothetical protein [Thermococcus sp.]|uniref:hypothetical protein n=1 Tax=Thermococcus sp. TaxID=35749 RepID=UPI002621FBEC|nr:hypothetical protein [Thermococcus sp.]
MEETRNKCGSPHLYISLILIFSTKDKKIKNKLDDILDEFKQVAKLKKDKSIKQEFEKVYNIAYKFFYNNFYFNKLKIEYLGHDVEDSLKQLGGNVRLDYVLVKNYYHNVYSLHVHFIFENQGFKWDDKNDPFLENISKIFGKIYDTYQSKPEEIPFESLKKLMIMFQEEKIFKYRESTYPVSFYTYISVCNLNKEQVDKWENNSVSIYRLLYLHPRGINENEAKNYLSRNTSSTASFYRNFFQPGVVVSISTRYPEEIYHERCKAFLPTIDDKGELSREEFYINNNCEHEYRKYDLIPEYPPLRYLGLLSLEFSGFIEENLRYMYEDLLGLYKNKYLRLLKYIFFPLYLEDVFSFYKNLSLEPIRLPGTRNYIERVIDIKKQATIEDAIGNLNNAIVNVLISIMTFMLLMLTFVLLFKS